MARFRNTWTIESPKALGTAIRSLRRDAGLTQTELADTLGTSRQRVARVEDGEVSAQVLLILRAMRQLGAELRVERRGD